MSRSSLGPRLSGSRFDTSRSLSRSQFVGSRIDATESTTATTACRSYQSSQSGNPDECQCGWPRRDHSVCKSCPTCDYKWLDRYNKDECPKCLEPLSSPTISKRMLGEASTHKQPPISAMESYSGVCSRVADPDGGPHHWKFGKCVQCDKGEGEEAKERQISQGGTAWARSGVTWAQEANITVAATRRACPTCGFAWRDVYGKPECPKCFGSLGALVPRRRVGEVSTHKQPPMSAMESSSGECLLAPLPGTAYLGPHRWKWGKCARCGKGEGDEAKLRQIKIEAAQEQVRQHVRKSRERLGLDNINELGPRMMGEARRGDSKLVACWGRPVKSCPTCFFAWFDVYGKNECPKCLQDLEGEYAPKPPGARASRARSPGRYSVSEALLASLSEKAAPVFGV